MFVRSYQVPLVPLAPAVKLYVNMKTLTFEQPSFKFITPLNTHSPLC